MTDKNPLHILTLVLEVFSSSAATISLALGFGASYVVAIAIGMAMVIMVVVFTLGFWTGWRSAQLRLADT